MRENYLVVYDISDARRLQKVAVILLDYGIRVQKSVFEVQLYESELQRLRQRLKKVVEPTEDGIKIFRLCESCYARRVGVGKEINKVDSSPWIIV